METDSPLLCRVYADMSERHGATGFCAIADIGGVVRSCCGDLTGIATGTAAEFEALAEGLRLCPVGADVIAHSDISDLPFVMNGGRVSFQEKIQASVDRLAFIGRQFLSIEWRLVSRGNGFYCRCHRVARIEAGRAAVKRRLIVPRAPSRQPKAIGLLLPKKWAEL